MSRKVVIIEDDCVSDFDRAIAEYRVILDAFKAKKCLWSNVEYAKLKVANAAIHMVNLPAFEREIV